MTCFSMKMFVVVVLCAGFGLFNKAHAQEIQQGAIVNYEIGAQNTIPSDATGPGIIHEVKSKGTIISVDARPSFGYVVSGNNCPRWDTQDENGNPCAPITERRMIGYGFVGLYFDDSRCNVPSYRQVTKSCLPIYLRGIASVRPTKNQEFEVIIRRIIYPGDVTF